LTRVVEHSHIDVVKVDLEGWEFEVLPQILQPYIASGEPLPFGQLLIEVHTWDKKFEDFLTWWEQLEAAGLRPFMTEARITCNMSHLLRSLMFTPQVNLVYQNYNKGKPTDLAEVCLPVLFPPFACLLRSTSVKFSFINIKGNNVFISDPQSPPTATTDIGQ